MSSEDMASNIRKSVTSKRLQHPASAMESALKDLYKNAEEKLSCACLIHKDMRAIVINYVRQQKPWLIQSEVEKRADVLLKKSYEDYKKERNSTINVIRRSFRKAARKQQQPPCGCGNNKISFITKLTRRNSNYKELQESFDEENCNCQVTCSAQYKPDNFLRPLERFVTINRSFKLKLKHLDQEKYGHLVTDTPVRKSKVEDEEPAILSTPNKSFRVKMEDTSTPTSKAPQYRLHFIPKSPMIAEKILNKSCNHEKVEILHGNSSKQSVKDKFYKSDKIENRCSSTSKNHEARNNQTFIRESLKEVNSREQSTQKEVVVKFAHCDNHCFLCTLENEPKIEPQLVYCRNHCPKCIVKSKDDADIIKPITVTEKTHKKRSKSTSKITKKFPSTKSDTFLLDDSMQKQVHKGRPKKIEKENAERFMDEDGLFVFENNANELNLSLEDYLEWDSMGLGLSPTKVESKRKISWSNTASVLENIKNNHLKPIKQDLTDIQQYFKVLRHKYKF